MLHTQVNVEVVLIGCIIAFMKNNLMITFGCLLKSSAIYLYEFCAFLFLV